MIPVLSPDEVVVAENNLIAAGTSQSSLARKAGWAVARAASQMLAGAYGSHIVVIVGDGKNGADGRIAGELLRERGAGVEYLRASDVAGKTLPPCDLVLDAAYGIGLNRNYTAPRPTTAPVLSVDIASGIDAKTGVMLGSALHATRTLTFGALKPGLLLGDGLSYSGHVELVDIGLGTEGANVHVFERSDAASATHASVRSRDAHKWSNAVAVIAGSPGMIGAASLCAQGAMRAGSGMVRMLVPEVEVAMLPPGEWVARSIEVGNWSRALADDLSRCSAVVIGPGLGRGDTMRQAICELAADLNRPLVLDADALRAFTSYDHAAHVLRKRLAPTVLTPHDGELEALIGRKLHADRLDDVRALAKDLRVTLLAKGATTLVASHDLRVRMITSRDSRLATAGTGDVLGGVVGAFLARGAEPFDATSTAAWIHANAALRGRSIGLTASDLPELIADELSDLLMESS